MLDPTTASRLAITPPPQQIEFTRLPSKALLHALNTHLGSHPNTIVRFFFDRGDWTSLKFLREIPNVRQLLLQNTNMRKPITDLAPLAYVDELRLLSISHIAPKQMDFTPLLRFAKCLRDIRIWIDKKAHGNSYFQVLPQLTQLRALGVPHCDFADIIPLKNLTSLNLGSGPFDNLEMMAAFRRMKWIQAFRSKLPTIDPLLAHRDLETVELVQIPNCGVTSLPNGSAVKFVYVDGFKSLAQLDNLVSFPRLNTLVVRNSHLPPACFAFINRCSKMKRVFVEYSTRKQKIELRRIVKSGVLIESPVFPERKSS